MTTAKKPNYRDRTGAKVVLGATLGQGGEAIVYEVEGRSNTLAKIYRVAPPDYSTKLAWMIGHVPSTPGSHIVMAWPTDLVLDKTSVLSGYLMPRIPGAVALLTVFNPRKREQLLPNFNLRYRYRAARNLAAATQSAHDAGYVVGDLNESNALVTSTALVSLLDTDSFQVRVPHGSTTKLFRSPVGKPEYTAPELQGLSFRDIDRTEEHDRFALGVLIFQLLMEGNHPFRHLWHGSGEPPDLEDSIRHGWFPYSSATPIVAPPPGAPELDALDPSLAALVSRCFVEGHSTPARRPTAAEWQRGLAIAETGLRTCSTGHIYAGHLPKCPECSPSRKPISTPQSRGARRPKKSNEKSAPVPVPPPPFGSQPDPVQVLPTPSTSYPSSVQAKKRPGWLKWVAIVIAILVIRNALMGQEASNQSLTASARATSTARARSGFVARTPTAVSSGSLDSQLAWGFSDDFRNSSELEPLNQSGVSAEVEQGRFSLSVTTPGMFYWIEYPNAETERRDFAAYAKVGEFEGTGEVLLRLHSVSTNDDWFFAVDPLARTWMVYRSSSESNEPFLWITPRDYSVLGKLNSVEVKVLDGSPALLLNGIDVASRADVALPAMPGNLIVGFGVHAAPNFGSTFSATFARFQLFQP